MCGRVHRTDWPTLKQYIENAIDEHGWEMARLSEVETEAGEGFPTNTLPTLREAREGIELSGTRWGVRPAWSKRDLINTRQETMTEKSTWSKAFRERRCALPVAGFYEWLDRGKGQKKLRHWIGLPDRDVMVLAGLWSDSADHGPCCSIVTTNAGRVVGEIHDRQPVILPPQHVPRWLDPGITERGPIEDLLQPIDELIAEPEQQILL